MLILYKLKHLLFRAFRKWKETLWKYKRFGSDVRIQGKAAIDPTVLIKNSNIYVDSSSSIILHKNVKLEGISFFVLNGAQVEIGECCFIMKDRNSLQPEYIVNNGRLIVADHTKLACMRLWIRFGGKLEIGQYTNINSGTEIRADEHICIGNYCRISYNIRIWDTNTHCIYSPEKRRALTYKYFPRFGYECERPRTKPVTISDGCWLGERVSILKGTFLKENVTVAYHTTIINRTIPRGKTVTTKIDLSII